MRKDRILIVEDETDVLDANRMHLEMEGYEVVCAINLHEARNAVWEQPPDLILLDVLLPDGSGYDFCGEVRKFTAAPILFLTCMGSSEQIVGGFALGADDYITKPYNMDVLSARIAARLRVGNTSVVALPPLRIDLHTGRVHLGKREVVLSGKEMQLLAFFAKNAGREFTADEIYRAVWDDNPTPAARNTVRVHISNLRSKLRLDDGAPFAISLTSGKKYMFFRAGAT